MTCLKSTSRDQVVNFYSFFTDTMDEIQLKKVLKDVFAETVPEMIEGQVEAKTAEKFQAIEGQLAELNKSVKFGLQTEEKETMTEIKKAVGNLFRSFKYVANGTKSFADIAEKAFGELRTKAPQTFMNETNNDEGAYLVPVEFAKEIFRVAGEYGLARRYSRIIPMWTDTKDISTLVNNVIAYWTDEGTDYTESKPTIWQVQLIAYKMTCLVSATHELIDDQMTDQDIWSLMSELIGEKIAEFEDKNVLVTSTKFTSLLVDSTVNVVNMSSGEGSFTDITYDHLIDLIRAVPTKYKRGQPRFFMNQDIVAIIDKLKDSNNDPLFRYTRTLENGLLSRTLIGYPLEESDIFPWIADDDVSTPFMLFGDLKFWAFGDRKSLSFSAWYLSGNREKDIQSLKANERIAGKVIFPKAFSVLKTSATT